MGIGIGDWVVYVVESLYDLGMRSTPISVSSGILLVR